MQQFKKVERKSDGRLMYFRDGRLVPASSIPETILNGLTTDQVYFGDKVDGVWQIVDAPDVEEIPPVLPEKQVIQSRILPDPEIVVPVPEIKVVLPEKKCIFTDGPALKSRWANGQIVYICDELINTKSIGQIVQRLREISK